MTEISFEIGRFGQQRSLIFQDELVALAQEAGRVVLEVREKNLMDLSCKLDGSPVTMADHLAQKIILDGLLKLTPDIPVVAEEKRYNPRPLPSDSFWLVDPIDATRDYISGGTVFTINIGLIIDHVPRVGVIYAPALDDLFYSDPFVSFRLREKLRTPLKKADVSVMKIPPYALMTNFAEQKRLPLQTWREKGWVRSMNCVAGAYKFGLLAAEGYDLYPRSAPSYEWDTAAGDALLRNLGGGIVTGDGMALTYGKTDFLNPPFLAFMQRPSESALLDYFKK